MGTLVAELRSYYFAPVSSAKRPLNYISLFPLCLSWRYFGHNRGHDFSCPLRERLTMRTVNCSKTSEHDVVLAEKKNTKNTREKTARQTKHPTLNIVSAVMSLTQRAVNPEPCISELFCVFFVGIKQKYKPNRPRSLLAHFHPFFISGILAMSPLLCPQALCCCKLPYRLHTSPHGTQEMGKIHWCSLNSLISICPSPAGETAQTKKGLGLFLESQQTHRCVCIFFMILCQG